MLVRLRRAVVQDAWYTLLGGRLVARSGIPHHNTLTVLAHGHTWVDQQWLGQLFFYGLWAAGGWGLSLVAVVALYVAAFAVLAAATRLAGASERSTALVTAVGLATGISNTVLRTQVAAYVLCAIILVLIVTDERKPGRRIFGFIPILILWANVHGSVLVGAGLVALYGATSAYAVIRRHQASLGRLLRPAGLLVLPWLCSLASPYGFALVGYYRHFSSNSTLQHTISEWAPSSIRSQPFFFVVLGAVLLVVFRQRAALGLFAQLAIVATAIGGLLANRNIVWFALVTAALVPAALDELWPVSPSDRRPQANRTIVLVTTALVVTTAGWAATRSRAWFENAYPQPAADVVARAAAGTPAIRVYADDTFADWLLFEHSSLDGRVSSDIRYELLSDAQLERIAAFESQSGTDWRVAASGYRLLVLSPSEPAVTYYREGGARTLYADGRVVVLEATARQTSPTAPAS
jgi:hypothetical protein